MTKRKILHRLGAACGALGWGGTLCIIAILASLLVLACGCMATHAPQTMAPPVASSRPTSQPAGDTVQAQQAGAVNVVSAVNQRADATANVDAKLTAQGLGNYTSQFGIGAAACVVLAALGMLLLAWRQIVAFVAVISRLCATLEKTVGGLIGLLRLDELGDQSREK